MSTRPVTFGAFVPQGWKTELVDVDGAEAKWAKAVEIAELAEQLGYDSIWPTTTSTTCLCPPTRPCSSAGPPCPPSTRVFDTRYSDTLSDLSVARRRTLTPS
jgi:hypothetical protein